MIDSRVTLNCHRQIPLFIVTDETIFDHFTSQAVGLFIIRFALRKRLAQNSKLLLADGASPFFFLRSQFRATSLLTNLKKYLRIRPFLVPLLKIASFRFFARRPLNSFLSNSWYN